MTSFLGEPAWVSRVPPCAPHPVRLCEAPAILLQVTGGSLLIFPLSWGKASAFLEFFGWCLPPTKPRGPHGEAEPLSSGYGLCGDTVQPLTRPTGLSLRLLNSFWVSPAISCMDFSFCIPEINPHSFLRHKFFTQLYTLFKTLVLVFKRTNQTLALLSRCFHGA